MQKRGVHGIQRGPATHAHDIDQHDYGARSDQSSAAAWQQLTWEHSPRPIATITITFCS